MEVTGEEARARVHDGAGSGRGEDNVHQAGVHDQALPLWNALPPWNARSSWACSKYQTRVRQSILTDRADFHATGLHEGSSGS